MIVYKNAMICLQTQRGKRMWSKILFFVPRALYSQKLINDSLLPPLPFFKSHIRLCSTYHIKLCRKKYRHKIM